jgi:hypothetical protein
MGRSRGSAHAAKKSRQVVGFSHQVDRGVSQKAAPGEGHSRKRGIADRREAFRAENAASGGGRAHRVYHEPHARPVAKVQGRKKAPSRMNIKDPGGPKNKSPRA